MMVSFGKGQADPQGPWVSCYYIKGLYGKSKNSFLLKRILQRSALDETL